MTGRLILGFVTVIAISLAPVAVLYAVLRAPVAGPWLRRWMMRHHLWRKPPLAPAGPPLEKLAADLRRLRPAVHSPRHGVPMVKHLGTVGVYDDRLVAAARALDVPTTLAELPAGFEREAERMRLEHALTTAGLSWELKAS